MVRNPIHFDKIRNLKLKRKKERIKLRNIYFILLRKYNGT